MSKSLTRTTFHAWASFDFINKFILTSIVASMIKNLTSFGTIQKSERSGVFAFVIVLAKLYFSAAVLKHFKLLMILRRILVVYG